MSCSPTWDDRRRPTGENDVTNTFGVGAYTCCMTFPLPAGPLSATWEPDVPTRLSPAEMDQYRAGRNALLREAARLTGKRIVVVE